MSGRDVAKGLTLRRPDVRVLYMSGYTANAIVHQGVLEPGIAFLQKPFSPAALLAKVREILNAENPPVI
jgi:DNA-binding response OmpR family regulator